MQAFTVAIAAVLASIAYTPAFAGATIEIGRVFSEGSNWTRIVISTNQTIEVKCALYDMEGRPIRTTTTQITPPIDEVGIRTGDKTMEVQQAKCWEMP